MNSKLKKTLFIILPIALGVFLIWYSLSKLSPSDKIAIVNSFKTANYWWVALSLLFGILSHFSRAYRWKFMLEPLGYKPKYPNMVMIVLITYLINLGIPRSGEIARATALSKYEKIPFQKGLGTIVAERIADVIMLLLVITIAFFYQAELVKNAIFKDGSNPTQKFIFLIIAAIIGYVGFRILKKSTHPFILKIKNFVLGLFDGVKSILNMKKKWAFLFHTFFIWTMYILMFYVTIFALPETSNVPFGAVIVGFVAGALSMALTNGGLGAYPVAVAGVFALYGVLKAPAEAFGWIMWTGQTIMILIFGGISFLLLPILNKEK